LFKIFINFGKNLFEKMKFENLTIFQAKTLQFPEIFEISKNVTLKKIFKE